LDVIKYDKASEMLPVKNGLAPTVATCVPYLIVSGNL
jgi:hypothetical protein